MQPFFMLTLALDPSNRKRMALPSHRAWLLREAEALFSFFERRIVNPLGGFYGLDNEGRPTAPRYGSADRPAREQWYRTIWDFIAVRFIDRENGGWRAQTHNALRPNSGPSLSGSPHISLKHAAPLFNRYIYIFYCVITTCARTNIAAASQWRGYGRNLATPVNALAGAAASNML
ncbi:MAG TPA: hypothetical protein VMF32_13210 [Xanthobacteraceae bacterium]|nr:hypothetical protein [Xanthobacteraceae bacterium]